MTVIEKLTKALGKPVMLAILEAIREPTDAMIEAPGKSWSWAGSVITREGRVAIYQAMIDALRMEIENVEP